ncbi:hypothetical protein [Moorena sp. SIO3I6]|uniref:hypothetical protein n=1 Tax=Moorena sp. SIO3I6 TaxID=2607831 RepID=UPI0013FA73D1|nr:hypothetical protein [Moorena sp. SIO3I6]NEP27242.1 hypothetical protein [Moorena sp. SIO3I6]
MATKGEELISHGPPRGAEVLFLVYLSRIGKCDRFHSRILGWAVASQGIGKQP